MRCDAHTDNDSRMDAKPLHRISHRCECDARVEISHPHYGIASMMRYMPMFQYFRALVTPLARQWPRWLKGGHSQLPAYNPGFYNNFKSVYLYMASYGRLNLTHSGKLLHSSSTIKPPLHCLLFSWKCAYTSFLWLTVEPAPYGRAIISTLLSFSHNLFGPCNFGKFSPGIFL